ncbi:Retrovirus-related Pol polyprotein from transposon TNT 1-94 [Sesbania bispinosa]|nr:Retrovirus-related Pol polyprotein from transposon TNT 1-94 [Sesbania bispinosa]
MVTQSGGENDLEKLEKEVAAEKLDNKERLMVQEDVFDGGGLNDEQWQTLVNLLNNVKLGATEKLTSKRDFVQWVIDSSVSHHMTRKLEYLTDVRNVLEWPVRLPDGKQTFSTKEGTMVLSDTLKIRPYLEVDDWSG